MLAPCTATRWSMPTRLSPHACKQSRLPPLLMPSNAVCPSGSDVPRQTPTYWPSQQEVLSPFPWQVEFHRGITLQHTGGMRECLPPQLPAGSVQLVSELHSIGDVEHEQLCTRCVRRAVVFRAFAPQLCSVAALHVFCEAAGWPRVRTFSDEIPCRHVTLLSSGFTLQFADTTTMRLHWLPILQSRSLTGPDPT